MFATFNPGQYGSPLESQKQTSALVPWPGHGSDLSRTHVLENTDKRKPI